LGALLEVLVRWFAGANFPACCIFCDRSDWVTLNTGDVCADVAQF
jgi:hypothetical protein